MTGKTNDKFEGLYYDPSELLSYGRHLNYIIGGRGIGKTYGFKLKLIKWFLEKGHMFVWLRRYEKELIGMENFFSKVALEFPNAKFEVKKNKLFYFYINDKIAGYGMELGKWNTYKGLEMNGVMTIVLDEFIIDKDSLYRYLGNEPEPLLNIADSVWRNLNAPSARIICLGNSDNLSNPFFTYFKIPPDLPFGITLHHDNMIAVERRQDSEFMQARVKHSIIGKLTKGTNYATMAIDNTSKGLTNKTFIKRKSKTSELVCILIVKGRSLGVWRDFLYGEFYISNKFNANYPIKYVLSMDDMNTNLQLVTNWKKEWHLSEVISAMKTGYLFYESHEIKNLMLDIFSKMSL